MKNQPLRTALELVDELKSLKGNVSDYRIAKILEVKPQAVSEWRLRGTVPSDETALRLADALGYKPEYVLACVHAQRSESAVVRAAWAHIAAAFGTAAALAAVAVLVLPLVQF